MLIALDWGLTRLRAYLLDTAGNVVERRESATGVLAIQDGAFQAALEETISGWPAAPVIASGMITSRQGWVETPYHECPAGPAEIAAGLRAHDGPHGIIHFVPGLVGHGPGGVPDVMRGEETQIVGALPPNGDDGDEILFLLPGTHSKWTRVAECRIQNFATFMTGEIFALLRDHSILGRMMSAGPDDPESFARGLDDAWNDARVGGLLHRLFGTRTLALFDELAAFQTADYLSGLLIGQEVADGLTLGRAETVTLVGTADLAARYETALRRRGVATTRAPDDVAATGLFAIALAAGLISDRP